MSNLNLQCFNVKPLPLVLSLHALAKKTLSSFLISPLQVLKGRNKVSPQPSLLQAEQPQISQPFLIGEVFHPSDHFCGPPLDPLQQLHVLIVLGDAELDAVLQMRCHQSRAKGQNHLPQPAGCASFDAAQGLLGCERTLPVILNFWSASTCKSFSSRLLSIHSLPSLYLCLGFPRPRCSTLQFALLDLNKVHRDPPLKPAQVPLDGIPSLQGGNRTTQLGVVGKLAKGALDPTAHVTDKDVQQPRSQYQP